jgi:hypothetical protein
MKRIDILKISLGLIRIQKGKKPRIRALVIVIPNTKTYQPRTFVIINPARIAIIQQYVCKSP